MAAARSIVNSTRDRSPTPGGWRTLCCMKFGICKAWLSRLLLVGVIALGGGLAVGQEGEESPAPRGSASSWSADLPVVSDGRHVWLWADKVDPKNRDRLLTALFHADATNRPPDGPVWESVTDFTGRLASGSVAADGAALWMIFDDGKVANVSLRPAPLEGDWYFRQQAGKSLPAHTTVRASVAAHGKLWVLARVETGQAIADLDRGASAEASALPTVIDDAEVMNLVLGLPRELPLDRDDPLGLDTPSVDQDESPESNPTNAQVNETRDATDEETEETKADEADQADQAVIAEAIEDEAPLPAVPADRLLVLDRGAWRVEALPADWESNRPTQLIAPRDASAPPTLLVQAGKTREGLEVTLYRPALATFETDAAEAADEPVIKPAMPRWTATALTLPAAGGVVGLSLDTQLVLAQHTPTAEGFAAALWAVRGDQLTAVGSVVLDEQTQTPAHGLWAALPWGDAVGVMAGGRETAAAVLARLDEKPMTKPAPGPAVTAVDLRGQTALARLRLDVEQRNPVAESADLMIMLTVVITSTVLLFSFWRRDPTANDLQLPVGVAVADLMRRGLAGLIDLAPGLWVATAGFGVPWEELYDRWPGRGLGATWGEMLPGLAAIGVVVGHTLVLEAATGRSLGKWATGLRVMTLAGERPRPWQAATRCALKTFDLIAYLLLILPVISPNRQRLGDMVARTVVVQKASAPDDAQRQEDEGKNGGDER